MITSHFPLHPASYPSVHIDAYNHALKQAKVEGKALPPVIWANALARGGIAGAGLCHLEREGLKFLAPVGQEGTSCHDTVVKQIANTSQPSLRFFFPGSIFGHIERLPGSSHRDDYQG